MIRKAAQRAKEEKESGDLKPPKANVAHLSAVMRVKKDLEHLDGIVVKLLSFNEQTLEMLLQYSPLYGIWQGGTFDFRLVFPEDYPNGPPKLTYLGPTRMWHPNIEGDPGQTEWGVCLSLLKIGVVEDGWTAVRQLRDVLFGLQLLFDENSINIDDPLPGTAKEAAQHLKNNPRDYVAKAKRWMQGNYR